MRVSWLERRIDRVLNHNENVSYFRTCEMLFQAELALVISEA